MNSDAAPPAIILFAHGARDPRWAEPFLRVVERVRSRAPELRVELAYLEHLEPNLDVAARRLARRGRACHPRRAAVLRSRRASAGRGAAAGRGSGRGAAGVAIELGLPAGDDDAVIDALAAFCVRAARGA